MSTSRIFRTRRDAEVPDVLSRGVASACPCFGSTGARGASAAGGRPEGLGSRSEAVSSLRQVTDRPVAFPVAVRNDHSREVGQDPVTS